jgi:hypothetical protein
MGETMLLLGGGADETVDDLDWLADECGDLEGA